MDDDHRAPPGDRIHVLLHGHPFDDVAVLDFTAHLGDNRNGIGIPVGEDGARLDLLPFFDQQLAP